MPLEEHGTDLDAEAADWVARVDGVPLSADEAQALESWLARSPRHRGAYARAQAALSFMDSQFMGRIATASHLARGISRRQVLVVGTGSAAAAAASVALVTVRPRPPAIRYGAEKGEIRMVSLADGSLITLDTASTVAVEFRPQKRQVELVTGRALFSVAKDAARPFSVITAGLKVEATGARFALRNFENMPIEVLVQEGSVDFLPSSDAAPMRVGANMRIVADSARGPLSVSPVDPTTVATELAWRQGLLAFEDVSLEIAVQQFARYTNARIIIPDPGIAAITITGLFSANNPAGFARTAALSLGLRIEEKGNEIRLLRS